MVTDDAKLDLELFQTKNITISFLLICWLFFYLGSKEWPSLPFESPNLRTPCHTWALLQPRRFHSKWVLCLLMPASWVFGKATPARHWEAIVSASNSTMTLGTTCISSERTGLFRREFQAQDSSAKVSFAQRMLSQHFQYHFFLCHFRIFWNLSCQDCINANITVMGQTMDARFRMNCSVDPCQLDIEVLPKGTSCHSSKIDSKYLCCS